MENAKRFVELNRTFHELSKHASDSDEVDISRALLVGSAPTWEAVLQNRRSVILSEAGSGKTQEILNLARKLRGEGKDAFFLRLEFIPSGLQTAFEVGTHAEFEIWLASDREGILLLDSIDEARLRSPQDFELAIRILGQTLNAAKGRVRIVITGRSHAWRARTDYALCESQIGAPPEHHRSNEEGTDDDVEGQVEAVVDDGIETKEVSDERSNAFKVFALDELNRQQVETFAKAKGVKDVRKFIEAIERTEAWTFTARPQDLEELIAFWLDKGAIGTRLDIIQNSVERRLTERDQQRADIKPLAADKAREGAMLVAAAATLSQNQTIRVPDGAENTSGFPLQPVLPGWTDQEISTLLSRPIFDEAIYGAVRFHHRSVREYLAASWMLKLLERPASRRAIEALLFKKQFGVDVVIPTTRPLLPWLAISDEKIREKVRRIAPEIIFEGGDPSALPVQIRREILAEVCERLASGKVMHTATEYSAVQRFAHLDIAKDIRGLFKTYAGDAEVIGFLTRMIWLGQLKELAPEAKSIAKSANVSQWTRIAAMRALRTVGTAADSAEVREAFLSEAAELDREWLGELLTELPANGETIDWALQAIAKAKKHQKYAVDRLADAVKDFVDAAPIGELPKLVRGISELLAQPPYVDRKHCHVSQHFSWLMKAAARAIERLAIARHDFALEPQNLDLLYKFRAFRHFGSEGREIKEQFNELVPSWPALNQASFWHNVEGARAERDEKSGPVTWPWQARSFDAFWKFGSSDFEVTHGWILSRSSHDDKLIALSLAFSIYAANGRPKAWRELLKKTVAGDAVLEERLSILLHPPKQDSEHERFNRKWKRRAAAHRKREGDRHAKAKEYLTTHVEQIRDPKLPKPTDVSQNQWFLHEKAREKAERSSKWTGNNWRELIPLFGKEVAEAFRDAVTGYWRRYTPQLLSEGATARSTPFSVIYGLASLATEIGENPKAFDNLTDAEADIAARFAVNELNGFPDWFPAFYARYPNAASKVILKEIEYEFANAKPDSEFHYVLSDISWSAQWTWDHLAPALFSMLYKAEPKNASQLHQLLKIIQGSSIPDGDLAKLAADKVQSELESSHKPLWFAAWSGVEPEQAIPAFAAYLETLTDGVERTNSAMNYVTNLWGGMRSEAFEARPAFVTPQHLKSLYTLMHEHIRVDEDIDRANGGVYSPELRDKAQDSRNRILQELNRLPGKEAFIALSELASLAPQGVHRAYLDVLTKQKAEQEADLAPWKPANVREFHDRLDRIPSTHQELADLAELRLFDLKDSLEEGDDSVAIILKDVDAETKIRNYLGHVLREKAFGRYSIPQEEELADAKKPDLRFHGVGFDAPLPAELKLADRWSGTQLFERLENQLAGDYLRDVRSGRGLFVLIYRGDKNSWVIPGTEQTVDFDGLVDVLERHWATISEKYPGVESIKVIGIDLTKRNK
jgi:hypothetical protein